MKRMFLTLSLMIFSLSWSQKNLPNVTLNTIGGEKISTEKNFNEKDKLYVFSFWATWCAPCIQELEAINDVYPDWKSELNVEIVAVATDDEKTAKRVKPLVNGKGWDYTVLLDTNQDFKRSLGISNVPYLIVVKNQQIVFVQNGHVPGGENGLYEKLKSFK